MAAEIVLAVRKPCTRQVTEDSIVTAPDIQSPQEPFSWGAASGVRHMAQELEWTCTGFVPVF